MKTSWIYYYVDYRLPNLTFSCVMLKNAQTYIKKSCGVHTAIF